MLAGLVSMTSGGESLGPVRYPQPVFAALVIYSPRSTGDQRDSGDLRRVFADVAVHRRSHGLHRLSHL